jgi:FtsP/CotA-like multicopper oxidase with cupredoxin domain
MNNINPVRRDVVSIGGENDEVLIQFTTVSLQYAKRQCLIIFQDNPGPWIMHCHIDDHLNRGFAMGMFSQGIVP